MKSAADLTETLASDGFFQKKSEGILVPYHLLLVSQ